MAAEFIIRLEMSARAYIRSLGRINARVAAMADRVYELVAGIPICLKGETA